MVIDNYPDTVVPMAYGTGSYGRILLAHTRYVETSSKNKCIEGRFRNGKKYWVYFIDNDSLNKYHYSVSDIPARALLERRTVGLEELEANDFALSYND